MTDLPLLLINTFASQPNTKLRLTEIEGVN